MRLTSIQGVLALERYVIGDNLLRENLLRTRLSPSEGYPLLDIEGGAVVCVHTTCEKFVSDKPQVYGTSDQTSSNERADNCLVKNQFFVERDIKRQG